MQWCQKEGYKSAGETLVCDWEETVTFYMFQKTLKASADNQHVESPFAALRLRTDAVKRYKKVENATAVIRKMLLLAEQRFRRPDALEKMRWCI